MLLRFRFDMLGPVALFKLGQRRCFAILRNSIIAALLIKGQKSLESYRLACRPEYIAAVFDIYRGGVQNGVTHLAGDEPRPYEPVKPVLIGSEISFYRLGIKGWVGRPYGLMSILSTLFCLENPGLFRGIIGTVPLTDIASGLGQCLLRNTQ